MQHVFIVGSKGIPGAYGGYETFVDKLTEYHQNYNEIKYHVACKGTEKKEEEYHNARCFNVKVPNIGPAQAIYYDVAALSKCCKYIKKETHISMSLFCVLSGKHSMYQIHHYIDSEDDEYCVNQMSSQCKGQNQCHG